MYKILGSGVRKSQEDQGLNLSSTSDYLCTLGSCAAFASQSVFIREMEIISYLWGPLGGFKRK